MEAWRGQSLEGGHCAGGRARMVAGAGDTPHVRLLPWSCVRACALLAPMHALLWFARLRIYCWSGVWSSSLFRAQPAAAYTMVALLRERRARIPFFPGRPARLKIR